MQQCINVITCRSCLCQGHVTAKIMQVEHKIPISYSVFQEIRGLTTTSYIVCDCTTSGHNGPVEYKCTVYTVYVHFYTMCVFSSNAVTM
jgi:hypothetical protein